MTEESNLEESLDFVSRQIVFLTEDKGMPAEEALSKLSLQGNESVATASKLIENVINNNTTSDIGKASPFITLTEILKRSNISDDKLGDVLVEYIKQMRDFRHNVNAYALSLKNSFSYSAALVVLAFVISTIYNNKVMPNFDELFTEFGSELPVFTSFMINGGMYIVFGLLGIATIFIISLGWTLQSVISSANEFKPVKSWTSRLFISQQVIEAVNEYLFICFAFIVLKGTNDPSLALQKSSDIFTKSNVSGLTASEDTYIKLSKNLDTLDSELEYQLEISSEKLAKQLIKYRTGINIAFQVGIFLIIGALVISYYLPIFMLGSVI